MIKSISVLIPVYNEKSTIKECIKRVLKADTCGLKLEIIVSDNNSNDGSVEILKSINDDKLKCIFQKTNLGKFKMLQTFPLQMFAMTQCGVDFFASVCFLSRTN